MSNRNLQIFDEYRYGPRGILTRGDRCRVSGGPIYVTDEGKKVPIFERGVFVLQRHCQRGSARWIEAFRDDGGGLVVLWVGRSIRSRNIPNLRNRQTFHNTNSQQALSVQSRTKVALSN